MRRILHVLITTAALVLLVQTPAFACSMPLPPNIAQLTGEASEPADFNIEAVTGVYQLETVAAVPSMGFRDRAAATVVTRYWGQPPGETGVEVMGGQWLNSVVYFTDCEAAPMPPVGESGYGFGINGDPSRYVSVQVSAGAPYAEGTMHGELTIEDVASLDEAYGPHTTIPITLTDRAQGTATVWYPNVLVLAILGGIIYLIIRRLTRRTAANPNPD